MIRKNIFNDRLPHGGKIKLIECDPDSFAVVMRRWRCARLGSFIRRWMMILPWLIFLASLWKSCKFFCNVYGKIFFSCKYTANHILCIFGFLLIFKARRISISIFTILGQSYDLAAQSYVLSGFE
jgi:hypothetical protein